MQFGVVTDRAVWIPDGSGVVDRYDSRTLAHLGETRVGKPVDEPPPDAQALAVGKDGVWVTLGASRAVALLDVTTGKEIRRHTVDWNPYSIAVDGDELWVTDFEDWAVHRIDARTGKEKANIFVASPTGIAVGEGAVWVTVHEDVGRLMRIDPSRNEVVGQVRTGARPYTVAVGMGSVWTSDVLGGTVTRIDPKTTTVTATIQVGNEGVIDVEVAGGDVWAAVIPQSTECTGDKGWVDRIDPVTNQVVGRIPGLCEARLAVHDDRIWVTYFDAKGGHLSILEPTG